MELSQQQPDQQQHVHTQSIAIDRLRESKGPTSPTLEERTASKDRPGFSLLKKHTIRLGVATKNEMAHLNQSIKNLQFKASPEMPLPAAEVSMHSHLEGDQLSLRNLNDSQEVPSLLDSPSPTSPSPNRRVHRWGDYSFSKKTKSELRPCCSYSEWLVVFSSSRALSIAASVISAISCLDYLHWISSDSRPNGLLLRDIIYSIVLLSEFAASRQWGLKSSPITTVLLLVLDVLGLIPFFAFFSSRKLQEAMLLLKVSRLRKLLQPFKLLWRRLRQGSTPAFLGFSLLGISLNSLLLGMALAAIGSTSRWSLSSVDWYDLILYQGQPFQFSALADLADLQPVDETQSPPAFMGSKMTVHDCLLSCLALVIALITAEAVLVAGVRWSNQYGARDTDVMGDLILQKYGRALRQDFGHLLDYFSKFKFELQPKIEILDTLPLRLQMEAYDQILCPGGTLEAILQGLALNPMKEEAKARLLEVCSMGAMPLNVHYFETDEVFLRSEQVFIMSIFKNLEPIILNGDVHLIQKGDQVNQAYFVPLAPVSSQETTPNRSRQGRRSTAKSVSGISSTIQYLASPDQSRILPAVGLFEMVFRQIAAVEYRVECFDSRLLFLRYSNWHKLCKEWQASPQLAPLLNEAKKGIVANYVKKVYPRHLRATSPDKKKKMSGQPANGNSSSRQGSGGVRTASGAAEGPCAASEASLSPEQIATQISRFEKVSLLNLTPSASRDVVPEAPKPKSSLRGTKLLEESFNLMERILAKFEDQAQTIEGLADEVTSLSAANSRLTEDLSDSKDEVESIRKYYQEELRQERYKSDELSAQVKQLTREIEKIKELITTQTDKQSTYIPSPDIKNSRGPQSSTILPNMSYLQQSLASVHRMRQTQELSSSDDEDSGGQQNTARIDSAGPPAGGGMSNLQFIEMLIKMQEHVPTGPVDSVSEDSKKLFFKIKKKNLDKSRFRANSEMDMQRDDDEQSSVNQSQVQGDQNSYLDCAQSITQMSITKVQYSLKQKDKAIKRQSQLLAKPINLHLLTKPSETGCSPPLNPRAGCSDSRLNVNSIQIVSSKRTLKKDTSISSEVIVPQDETSPDKTVHPTPSLGSMSHGGVSAKISMLASPYPPSMAIQEEDDERQSPSNRDSSVVEGNPYC